jgi:hypothetical protein
VRTLFKLNIRRFMFSNFPVSREIRELVLGYLKKNILADAFTYLKKL